MVELFLTISVFPLATEIKKHQYFQANSRPMLRERKVGKREASSYAEGRKNNDSKPLHLLKSHQSKHCLIAALCGLSKAAPLKARSDKLTKVNFLKLLCHQTFMSLLPSYVNLQSDSAYVSICRLKGKMDIMFIFIFIDGTFILLQNSERIWQMQEVNIIAQLDTLT